MSENLFQHVNFRESQIPLIGYQIMNPYTLFLSPIYNFNFHYLCLVISGIQHAIFDHLTKMLEKNIVIRKGDFVGCGPDGCGTNLALIIFHASGEMLFSGNWTKHHFKWVWETPISNPISKDAFKVGVRKGILSALSIKP